MTQMTMADAYILKKMLIRHEEYRDKLYQDSEGKWTIGIGYNIEDRGLPEDIIYILFERTVREALQDCKRLFGTWKYIPGNRKIVLINMMFNLGYNKLSEFKKLRAAIADENWNKAADEMLDSLWAKQVKGRAIELANIMRSGEYEL